MAAGAAALSDTDVARYRRDGVVVLRGLLGVADVDALRAVADAVAARPGPAAQEAAPEGRGRFLVESHVSRRFPDLRRIALGPRLGRIAARAMGARAVRLVFDQILIKEPATPVPTLWHRDLEQLPFRGDQFCTVWIALDASDARTGALAFQPGSHRAETAQASAPPRLAFDLAPGDATLHHGMILHGAGGNDAVDRRRRGYALRLAGDDLCHAPREGTMALPEDLQGREGQSLASPGFPLLPPA